MTTACGTPLNFITTTTGSTAADATFPPLSTNELAKVILKKKREKRVDRLNHDARNHMGGSRGGGGAGGPDPPGKSQVIWVSIGKKQLDPLIKVGPSPLEYCSNPIGTLANNSFLRM